MIEESLTSCNIVTYEIAPGLNDLSKVTVIVMCVSVDEVVRPLGGH